jgi:hypothetical protein
MLFLRVPEAKPGRTGCTSTCARRPGGGGGPARELGRHRVDVGQGETCHWVVMADPDGNEFCVLRALTGRGADAE